MEAIKHTAFSVYKRFTRFLIIVHIKFRINQTVCIQFSQASQSLFHLSCGASVNQIAILIFDPITRVSAIRVAPAFDIKLVAIKIIAECHSDTVFACIFFKGCHNLF